MKAETPTVLVNNRCVGNAPSDGAGFVSFEPRFTAARYTREMACVIVH